MNKFLRISIFFALIFAVFLSAIAFSKEEINDFFGRKKNLPDNPKQILSLTPATTEILYLLGLEKNIAGVTLDCNYPPEAQKKTKLGKFGFIDFEKIISLKPDLIFATSDMNKQLDVLKTYNVPVIALNTPSIDSIIENVSLVGKYTGKTSEAGIITKDLRSRINKVIAKAKKSPHPKVFYCVWHDPLITAGNKSFIGDMISIAGGINIAGEIKTSFAKYSIESLLEKNPDFIIVPKSTYSKMDFKTFPWNKIKAVKNNNVISVNEDIYQRPSPRIVDALEEIQKNILKK